MKFKTLLFFTVFCVLPALFFGQKKTEAQKKSVNIKVKAPEQYYSESGIPLRVEEKRDTKGQLIEKIFYRHRSTPKSDTINEKQLYTNGKISETQYYTGAGKLSFATKYNAEGKEAETTFYEENGEIHDKSVYTNGGNGTSKTARYGKGGILESLNTTDQDGRQLENISYSKDGTIRSKEVCQYDGRMESCKQSECFTYNSKNTLIRKEIYSYITKRKEITSYFSSGKIESFKIYENAYTGNGTVLEVTNYTEDGSYSKQTMQQFKEKDYVSSKASEINSFDATGKLLSKWVAKYDATGNTLENSVYDAGGKLYYKDTFKNDEKGVAVEIIRNKADGTTEIMMKDGKYIK